MMAMVLTPRKSSACWFQVAWFHRNELPGTSSELCESGTISAA
jgi:hypothetical protein